METERHTQFEGAFPDLPCACANLRRAARAVTRMYNHELQPSGLELTQFTLLMALDRTGETTQGNLSKLLALDTTSLTRMLKILIKRGWIGVKEGDDRRFRNLWLTGAGGVKLKQTLPLWKRAQDRMQSALGEGTMRQLADVLSRVTVATAGA